jgi:hypothetical protein
MPDGAVTSYLLDPWLVTGDEKAAAHLGQQSVTLLVKPLTLEHDPVMEDASPRHVLCTSSSKHSGPDPMG